MVWLSQQVRDRSALIAQKANADARNLRVRSIDRLRGGPLHIAQLGCSFAVSTGLRSGSFANITTLPASVSMRPRAESRVQ